MSDLELRTQAVHQRGAGAYEDADEAIAAAEALGRYFGTYKGMAHADHYVAAGLADVAEALGYLRRARATIQPIVDARLAEERGRQ